MNVHVPWPNIAVQDYKTSFLFVSDLRMTIAPIVRMRSIISEKNCLENSGNDLEYQQLQSDNSSSNSDLDSQSELKPGKARRSTQVKFINFPFFIQFSNFVSFRFTHWSQCIYSNYVTEWTRVIQPYWRHSYVKIARNFPSQRRKNLGSWQSTI